MAEQGARLRAARPRDVGCKPGAGLVTDMDVELERALRPALVALLPGSSLFGEEEGGTVSSWTWWLDPLDGTTNFVHGWPRSAISLGLYRDDQPVLGLTHDPYLEESFWAIRGEGAYLDGRTLRVREHSELKDALLATGFGPEPDGQWDMFRAMHGRARGVRVSGCASLDCAYVAAGRIDAYWEIDLQPWDVAAGLLLVAEAGGQCFNLKGEPAHLRSADFLFAAPGLVEPLLTEFRQRLWSESGKSSPGTLPSG